MGLYYGSNGFMYKNKGAGGVRKNPAYGLILGVPANVNNKYVPGAGVGGTNISVRRAKMIHATSCNKTQSCAPFYMRLGLNYEGQTN